MYLLWRCVILKPMCWLFSRFLWAEIWRSRRCGLCSNSTNIENIEYRYIEARQRLECDYYESCGDATFKAAIDKNILCVTFIIFCIIY